MAVSAPITTQNNRGGSGRGYTPMRRQNRQQIAASPVYKKDARMRFKNSKDPVFVAFDYIDKQSIPQLAADFVKDTVFDIMQFVSNVASVMK